VNREGREMTTKPAEADKSLSKKEICEMKHKRP
jgi:hypothetical protein